MRLTTDIPEDGRAVAARHALGWLTLANAVGVWLAALLLWPDLGKSAGEFTYGRWVPVHLNLQLYGWTSLPLIVWLFTIYGVDRSPASRWAGAVVRGWSAALAIGVAFWLCGHTSGKLFLDWKDGSLAALIAAQVFLWVLLAAGWWSDSRGRAMCISTLIGLIVLAGVPIGMALAAAPSSYPPFDRTTGGPTGGSLLGSSLPVVALLLWTPRVFALPRSHSSGRWLVWLWLAEAAVFGWMEKIGGTHHAFLQIGALGLLIPWLVLVPWDWRRFQWPDCAGFWKKSVLIWWAVLLVAGWIDYLPGVLDRLKFTDGLVAHAHLAMAGFTSSFGLLLITMAGGPAARVAVSRGGFLWNATVAAHVISLLICGWLEGESADWMDHRPVWREAAFLIRLASGLLMAGIALYWWRRSFTNSKTPSPQ